ncbi:MAG: nucleotide exchange factor GrpE [Candidatus Thalassarchaeaceae archaeon]|nr:nucleotide exchange factor GrpE [Candidatus Thalassarchaeaceae archaeon]
MTEEAPVDETATIVEEDPDFEAMVSELEKEIQYAKAETANAVQRASRDRSEALKYGGSSLARRIIPAIDHLSKAVDASEGDQGAESVIEGVRMTLDGLRASLEAEGISQIDALGKKFDPTCMEAIATIPCPEGEDPGSVIEVIESGYRMHDRILRASRVIVAEGDS